MSARSRKRSSATCPDSAQLKRLLIGRGYAASGQTGSPPGREIIVVGLLAGLLERDAELARVDELLDAARGGDGRLLLIVGPAGIGKTCLLEECARAALAREVRVLRARGDELVVDSSYAAVRELFSAELRSAGEEFLVGAAGLALPVFGGDAAGGGDPGRAGAALHGLYWLVANVAERGPLVLLVDDAHWLDPASARFLEFLARRLDGLPVLLAVAMRSGEGIDLPARLRVLSDAAASVLAPAALSEAASAVLVRDQLGARADEELCRSCHQMTGGNPFYLREVTRGVSEEGEHPTAELAARVRERGVRVISRRVLVRLARLGDDCEALAQALGVLGPGCRMRDAAVLASLDPGRAAGAADRLRAVDLVSGELELSFVHPIVAGAIAAELPPSRRARLHRLAARLLLDDGAAADRVAAHLLAAEPFGEAWAVEALRVAARLALAQGAPEAAVSYLRRARAEPPGAGELLAVLMELGRAEALLPVEQDFPALREALELARDPNIRAEVSESRAMQDQNVFIVGAGNSAGQAALHLAKHASSVTLLVRGDSLTKSMSSYLIRAIESTPNIAVRLRTEVVGGGAGERLEHLDLRDRATGTVDQVPTAALFIMIGEPHTHWLPHEITRDGQGYLITGRDRLHQRRVHCSDTREPLPPRQWTR
jgi:AAA ATPase domain/Pyridine nucleotide-disulphide oxidoreductase